jgi:hypothetical protein
MIAKTSSAIRIQGSHQTRPLIVMVLESLYPTYRGQENQITKRVIILFHWSRQKQHTTYVAEKDVKVFLCRLETAILAASFTAWEKQHVKSSQ